MILARGRPDSLQLTILRSSAHKAFKVLQYGKGRETATKCRGTRDEEQGANLPSFILLSLHANASTLHISDLRLLKLFNSAQPQTMVNNAAKRCRAVSNVRISDKIKIVIRMGNDAQP